MIKKLQELWDHLRQDRGQLRATVQVAFFPNKEVTPQVSCVDGAHEAQDTISLALLLYARILYELAEINETRSAKELMSFLAQVTDLVLSGEAPPHRPRLPLGDLRLEESSSLEAAKRTYRAEFFQLRDGQYRLHFEGSLGKEGVYLPAMYVVFLQDCLNRLTDDALLHLARCLRRLHSYYKFRRDFWDSIALTAGPAFALGKEELRPEEADMEE